MSNRTDVEYYLDEGEKQLPSKYWKPPKKVPTEYHNGRVAKVKRRRAANRRARKARRRQRRGY